MDHALLKSVCLEQSAAQLRRSVCLPCRVAMMCRRAGVLSAVAVAVGLDSSRSVLLMLMRRVYLRAADVVDFDLMSRTPSHAVASRRTMIYAAVAAKPMLRRMYSTARSENVFELPAGDLGADVGGS